MLPTATLLLPHPRPPAVLDLVAQFYAEQYERMVALGHEAVPFSDICTQMHDLVHPLVEGSWTLKDFLNKVPAAFAATCPPLRPPVG